MTKINQNIPTDELDPYIAGDSLTITVEVDDETGAAKDLTGASITWALANAPGDSPLASKTVGSGISILDASGGVFIVELDGSETDALGGEYYHEAEVVDSGGKRATVMIGDFVITPDTA